jgi:L-rhamnose mutarotase
MGLLGERTNWIFLLPASFEAEDRHIHDVAYGVFCLEKKGIAPENITVIIDGDKSRIIALLQIASTNNYTIYNSSDLNTIFQNNIYDNIVLFVTGHGNINGLASNPPIKPYPLLHSIRTAPNLKHGVIYLGQCYAVIFNYMRVKNYPQKGTEQTEAPLVVIGATSLYESIRHC